VLQAARARVLVRALPSWVPWVELRLDRMAPEDIAAQAWLGLPADCGREWLATWRSPEEGGEAGSLPSGLYARALEAGFRWVDVEARALENRDPEMRAIPAERRWVSAHLARSPADFGELRAAWARVAAHPAVVQKLVLPADGFEVNDRLRELSQELEPGPAWRALFAQGWTGHLSRILDFWGGHSVLFLTPDDEIATAEGQPTVDRAGRVYGLPRIKAPTAFFGVLGNPARHSRSPEIHNHVFRTLDKSALYLPLESPAALPVLEWVRRGKLAGVSVTAPYKESVVPLLDELEEPARRIGAVNTIWRESGRLWGANTDFEAARDLMTDLGFQTGDAIAVLGAGGSARALIAAAVETGLRVTLFNRDPSRGAATALACRAEWGGEPTQCLPQTFSAVANTTPMGGADAIPEALLEREWGEAVVIDLVYGPEPTAWERLARARSLPFRGGLEFLARQAAGQLERWIGVRPAPALLAEGLAR
jgi:shikimate dehydrogenase